ncbi:MAG: hypothetical protein QOH12_2913 [Solirubrobacteraceae bacterium]|nr:hypothetical protein [Solirubrobacteraceae bacterium]
MGRGSAVDLDAPPPSSLKRKNFTMRHQRLRLALTGLLAVLAISIGAGPALASQGSGGSSGGGGAPPPPPPPSTSPGASLTPSAITYGPQDVGTTSGAQTVTLTNTGTASLFISRMAQGGIDPLDFAETNDLCIGSSVAPGASCTLTVVFTPTATGTRTATISVVDNAANTPQVITFTGTGTSTAGPTPLSVDTTVLNCTGGACDIATNRTSIVNNFFFTSMSAVGDTAPPFTWALVGGALPPGVALFSTGAIYGTPTATGTYSFTVKVTDPTGKTATQAFFVVISPPPPPLTPAQAGCQHAPSQVTEPLFGSAIAGKTPSGQAIGDQSQLTACGGFTILNVSVNNGNLPNGTVLWVTLGEPVGLITISGGSGTMRPYNTGNRVLRKDAIGIFAQPPPIPFGQPAVLSGGLFS